MKRIIAVGQRGKYKTIIREDIKRMTKRVSSLKVNKQAEIDLQNLDKLNTILVPITALRFELAGWTKQGIHEYPLGDFLLTVQMLINQKESDG